MSLYDDEIYADLVEDKVFWEKKVSEMTLALHEQVARIAELEAALKPFSSAALGIAPDIPDEEDCPFDLQVTCGDLRAARDAMEGKDD